VSELESAGKLSATRDGWHRVAEHVLAAAQYADTGKIGLRPSTAGFATARPLHGGRQLRVAEADLIVTDGAGSRSAPLTTVGAAARFAGVTPGMPERVYQPATPLDLDDPLAIDPASARLLAEWYQLGDAALRRFADEVGADPGLPILWPEHFDLAITIDGVNYGVSPGDVYVERPYLYVGPQAGPPVRDTFWNATFGATVAIDEVPSADDAVAFFHQGRERLRA
jgi:hypothetical protein